MRISIGSGVDELTITVVGHPTHLQRIKNRIAEAVYQEVTAINQEMASNTLPPSVTGKCAGCPD